MSKKIKRETKLSEEQASTAPKEPSKAKSPSEDQVLATLKEVGKPSTSTELRDKLGLDKETGRDTVRRLMAKLAKDGKVKISERTIGKRKQYVYDLEESNHL